MLEFTIQKGDAGAGGTIQALAVVDTAAKKMNNRTPVVFTNPPLIMDSSYSYTPGRAKIDLLQTGVYQMTFQCTVAAGTGSKLPSQVLIQGYLNGTPIPGMAARHTFTSSRETETMTLTTGFQVSQIPASLELYTEAGCFTMTDASLTVMRLS